MPQGCHNCHHHDDYWSSQNDEIGILATCAPGVYEIITNIVAVFIHGKKPGSCELCPRGINWLFDNRGINDENREVTCAPGVSSLPPS